jgi:hypothetical protein
MNLTFRRCPIANGEYTLYGSCSCGGYFLQTNTFVKKTLISKDLFESNYGGCVCKCEKCGHLIFIPYDGCYSQSWAEVQQLWYDAEIEDKKI